MLSAALAVGFVVAADAAEIGRECLLSTKTTSLALALKDGSWNVLHYGDSWHPTTANASSQRASIIPSLHSAGTCLLRRL